MSPILHWKRLARDFGGLVILLLALEVRAEHYEINLTVEAGDQKVEGRVDDYPPAGGRYPRPVLRGKAGQPLTLQFFMTDVNPHEIMKNVTVRFYIVAQESVGQKEPPALKEGIVLQGKYTLDFKPQAKVGLRQIFRVPKPGAYLVRVQSENSGSDHEHFAAVDLKIE
ncbi:MAG TPA: hypothetical protein VHH73_14420 [Verrucomicrobiae bacterium]|nr:hypothetical protein [Verrucomicrobiae bacterium]